ncbi:unnamed protein product [Ranitomeya imitator]|uniref:Muscle-restricted coiled-coil protein n=1 Tax=Ranitomeya imitator TaxID=111125 RepID=A0ABN9MGZ9_9NEOB|nr:unnamed protein product [Ranitomeya imitator]
MPIGSDRIRDRPPGEYNITSLSHLSLYIGGVSTVLQNAVDKPLMPEDIECPTKVSVAKESSLDGLLRDKLYPPNDLSSDEEYEIQESRSTRLKKSGKQRIDNIKKAFSKESMQKTKQNFGKKVNRIRTRIVTPERRERIRQSGERLKQSGERFKQTIVKAAPNKETFKIKKKEKNSAPLRKVKKVRRKMLNPSQKVP